MPRPASLPRHASARIEDALQDTRIVTLEGPRQAGKSTLCGTIAAAHGMSSVTLDESSAREAARHDPTGFIADLGTPVFIDEVQRAPDLVLALKESVDRDPRPGRYLVTGSANLLLSPTIGDSLAGRVERVPLRPFTQAEVELAGVPSWLDELWAGGPAPQIQTDSVGRRGYAQRIVSGGFPALLGRTAGRRRAWLDDYLAAMTTRDVPDLVDVRRPDIFPALLRHLAANSGGMTSMRLIGQALSVDEKTVRSYVRLLELLHLVVAVPAWTSGHGGRAVRAPRLFIEDCGLLTNLLDADEARVAGDDTVTGRAYETFVAMELARLLPYTDEQPRMYHWRTQHGHEVDVVLENRRGEIIGIEIKSSASVSQADLRGMRRLRDAAGARFRAGLVLCTVRQTTPLGAQMSALPIEALWRI
jgi:predicted AAA+ superfamily ATPase